MANRRVNKNVKAAVLSRQKRKCFCCGKLSSNLSMHHIERQKDNPQRVHDPSNVVAVCRKCHEFLHQGEHKKIVVRKEQKAANFQKKEYPTEVLFFSEKEFKKTKFKNKKIVY